MYASELRELDGLALNEAARTDQLGPPPQPITKSGRQRGPAVALVILVLFLTILAISAIETVNDLKSGRDPSASSSASRPRATAIESDPRALTRLDDFTVAQMGQHLYTSYQIQGDWVVIHINPSLWDSMSAGQQRQLCDIFGKGTFMQAMNLSGAQLMVNETLIGNVVRAGGLQRFSPALESLK